MRGGLGASPASTICWSNLGSTTSLYSLRSHASAARTTGSTLAFSRATAKLVSGRLSKDDFKEAAVGVSKDAAKAAFELFLPGATAITGLTEDIITKIKEGANC